MQIMQTKRNKINQKQVLIHIDKFHLMKIDGFSSKVFKISSITIVKVYSNPTFPTLRYGVESNKNQSFIAAIANIYSKYMNKQKNMNISEMKQIIKQSISLSSFSSFQNGNLVNLFYDSNNANNAIKKYENEPIYKELNGQTNGRVEKISQCI